MTDKSTTTLRDGQEAYAVVTGLGTVRIERMLPGPIERVWSYLTDSNKRGTWLARGEMDLRVGGEVVHIFHNDSLTNNDDPPPERYAEFSEETKMTGRIKVVDPPRRLFYSWFDEMGDSEVRFELTPVDDQVRLVVTHTKITDREQIIGACGGWHVHLDILEARLEGRTPEGFWRSYMKMEAEYEEIIGDW